LVLTGDGNLLTYTIDPEVGGEGQFLQAIKFFFYFYFYFYFYFFLFSFQKQKWF